ncbi:hypothetical protein JOD82_001997 [Paenibacillus sp. 1182]|nr:hypothetical protein [Paenibacillus sp. 1182]
MLSFDPTDFIPKPLLWICTIPFMILLLPIGFLYCLIGIPKRLFIKFFHFENIDMTLFFRS